MQFINKKPTALVVRVTAACGTQIEAELHPGATLKLVAGNAQARVDLLPAVDEFTGLKAV